jgi:hypothetical protein
MTEPVTDSCIVNCQNEWGPLEEIIDGAVTAPWEIAMHVVTPVKNVERARSCSNAGAIRSFGWSVKVHRKSSTSSSIS